MDRIQSLIEKYLDGEISPSEKKELFDWYNSQNYTEVHWPVDDVNEEEVVKGRIMQRLQEQVGLSTPVYQLKPRIWSRIAIAASLIIFLSTATYFIYRSAHSNSIPVIVHTNNNIVPGGNKAILTLGNGKQVILTGMQNGIVNTQAGVKIIKKDDGQLVYQASNTSSTIEHVFNTIKTPRGGQYQIILPDGTKVWLNAATSLRYPANFTGLKERHIDLDGEAYFEVAHNAKCPFIVTAGKQTVTVLGTHFNIMAYNDEKFVKTTLLQGSVKLTSGAITGLLKPGEQGYVLNKDLFVLPVNTDEVTAWKNGLFVFNNTDLYTLMRQLSRWYDVNVQYENGVKSDVFFGKIERSASLTEVLKILELGGIHFKIEGRNIFVTK